MSARLPIRMCVLGLLIVFPNLLPAQQQPAPLIYASYYKCDPAPGGRLEAIVSDKIAPPLDRALSAGRISGWGWLRHHTGGSWDRAGYLLAPNLDALLDAVEELGQEMAEGLQELAPSAGTTRTTSGNTSAGRDRRPISFASARQPGTRGTGNASWDARRAQTRS